ncbi:MICOS complex subunit Mic19 [Columba guinea]|nr:MICOS complex subunit Mic19 [Columba guinea]
MGGGSSTRRVTFEADENENITVVKGVRLSDSVIDRMKEPSSPGGRPQSQHRSGSGAVDEELKKRIAEELALERARRDSEAQKRRLKQEQAYVRDEFGKLLEQERISSNEHLTRAILRERAATEEERQKAQRFNINGIPLYVISLGSHNIVGLKWEFRRRLIPIIYCMARLRSLWPTSSPRSSDISADVSRFRQLLIIPLPRGLKAEYQAKQLEEKDRELKKHDAYYKEQLARLEERAKNGPTCFAVIAPALRKDDLQFSFTAKYWLFVGVYNEHKC